MLSTNLRRLSAAVFGTLTLALSADVATADHSASADFSDHPFTTFFVGTSNPSAGPNGIGLVGGAPGYLNGISGGLGPATVGSLAISPLAKGQSELIAISIHLADTAGPSHSLSSLNDPALADIVTDLNASSGSSAIPFTAYAYNNVPPQFTATQMILSSGETANGGTPFDVALATSNSDFAGSILNLNFAGEINALDGITTISVTDVGAVAVPEPTGLAMLATVAAPAMLARRRRR
jgi:hypothetical protein